MKIKHFTVLADTSVFECLTTAVFHFHVYYIDVFLSMSSLSSINLVCLALL